MKYEYDIQTIDLLKEPTSVPRCGWKAVYQPTEHYSEYMDWHEGELYEKLNRLGREGWEIVSIDQNLLSGKSLAGNILLKRPCEK